MKVAAALLAIVGLVNAQNDSLRARSSRFRQLASSTWGQGPREPTVVRVSPNTRTTNQQSATGDEEDINEILARQGVIGRPPNSFVNEQPRAPIAPPRATERPQPIFATSSPLPPQIPEVPKQPVTVPPAIMKLLGIENLGIPGLFGTGPPAGPPQAVQPTSSAFGNAGSAAPFGVQVPGNPTWGELAAQNPELLKQLTDSGLVNQPVLTAASQPGLLNTAVQPGAAGIGRQLAGESPTGNGFLNILGALTKRLTEATGVRNILSAGSGSAGAAAQQVLPQFSPGVGQNGPPVAGLPRLPQNLALLPGGIPRDAAGQVDYVQLMSAVANRVTNGSSLSDVVPPNELQTLADNITDALLPDTADVDLSKFMGRWFEGINSPRASEQRCIVHHYGGLTDNGKTATFTALKIYREGSEFGQVRYSIGYAFRGGHHMGMLQMHTSEQSDPTPYWIYQVGPEAPDAFGNAQYEYAIVSNWVKYPVTVLVRDPDTFKQKYEKEVLRYLEENGFINGFIRAFNMLQPVGYENCQYSESTFQVFGK